MDIIKASTCDTVAMPLMSPHAAIFKAFLAKQNPSSSRLSAKASEFIFAPKKAITTSRLSPQAAPFVAMATKLVSMLSPQAPCFVPVPKHNTTPKSSLSAHAAPFTPAAQIPRYGNFANMRATLPLNYNPALKRIAAAIDSCQSALNSQRNSLKQQSEECARHYNAFIRWKYFERYDELCEDPDTEGAQYLADARNFRCTKCCDQSLELKQQFNYTSDKYMRLISIHDKAVDEIIPSPISVH
jgi:hypothetical protein